MKIRKTGRDEKIELQMTPMIDIVFQLLVFFIMTFKIVLPEGDFNIRMPSPSTNTQQPPTDIVPKQVFMTAGEDGSLQTLRLNDDVLGNFASLRNRIREQINDAGGPGTAPDQEVEIVADFDLHYENVIKAITAVSGYIDESGQRHKLIEKIRFAPPEEN